MDTDEARSILGNVLKKYRAISYAELKTMIDAPARLEIAGTSGATYQVVIEALWDDDPDKNIRVMGSIDDGGLRAFIPICDDFIVSPTGKFVGE